MKNLGPMACVFYIVVGIVTFGVAAERCQGCGDNFERTVVGTAGAMFWPLWWSWQIRVWT